MKLPKKKNESIDKNRYLKEYAKGWNTIIENVEYLCKLFGDEHSKEYLLKKENVTFEYAILPFFKGAYDCIFEIKRLNSTDKKEE